MSSAKTSVSFGHDDDHVEIKGTLSRINEIIEDHLAAEQNRRKRDQQAIRTDQKLIYFKGKWHLADHVGSFSFWPKEVDMLSSAVTVNGHKELPDGRIVAEAWCRHDMSFICLAGGEEQVADLPLKNSALPKARKPAPA